VAVVLKPGQILVTELSSPKPVTLKPVLVLLVLGELVAVEPVAPVGPKHARILVLLVELNLSPVLTLHVVVLMELGVHVQQAVAQELKL
jgi:hypothetical protein